VGRENEAGLFYYVMEVADCAHGGRNIDPATYCPRTLAYELDTRGRLPARECLQLGLELSEALRYLHSRQLIHRDIKPANIIFVNGMAKLADVGLVTHVAEAKRDPKHLGTEGFTPPEGPGTLWADVYSLGKVLCETSMGHASVQDSLPPPDEKEQDELLLLNEVFFKACHDDLACRYQSVEELQHDLMHLYDQLYGGVPDARP
jgi:serine/threonine protein kinase